jgi:hypothetical protein
MSLALSATLTTECANVSANLITDRGRLLGESDEFKHLRRAVEKAHGDRERAIASVCRFYNVRTLDALPGAVRGAVVALLEQ